MWMRRNVGVLIGLLVFGVMMLFAGNADALCPDSCELFWTAPTTYTDQTPIESQDLPLSYVVEWDGVVIATTGNLSIPLPKPYGHNVAHTARVKAITATGEEGEYSDPFPWSSPKGTPEAVDALGIGVR